MATTKTPVTRPSIPHFNIEDVFKSFGYSASQEEIDALAPAFGGRINPFQRGRAAVADFVRIQKAEQERQANDPLKKFIAGQEPKIGEYEKQANDVYEQLKGILSSAPKLFGELTPEQIDQYLAPIKEQARHDVAGVEGAFGRRGLVGSSIEAQSLAEQDRIFKQNTLSTGLQVGMSQQQQQAAAYQNQIAQLYGQASGVRNLVGQGTAALSAQDLAQMQFLAGLPMALRGEAAQAAAAADAGRKKTDWGSIGSLAGMGLGAALAIPTGGMSIPMGMALGGSLGGAAGNLAGGDTSSAAASAGQIPWWMMLNQRQGNATSGSSLVPSGAMNPNYGPREYANV